MLKNFPTLFSLLDNIQRIYILWYKSSVYFVEITVLIFFIFNYLISLHSLLYIVKCLSKYYTVVKKKKQHWWRFTFSSIEYTGFPEFLFWCLLAYQLMSDISRQRGDHDSNPSWKKILFDNHSRDTNKKQWFDLQIDREMRNYFSIES